MYVFGLLRKLSFDMFTFIENNTVMLDLRSLYSHLNKINIINLVKKNWKYLLFL